jgi:hypothetical protein
MLGDKADQRWRNQHAEIAHGRDHRDGDAGLEAGSASNLNPVLN